MDWAPYIGTIVTVLIAVISGYVAVASRIAKLETRIEDNEKLTRVQIEDLRRDVEKYNNVKDRTYTLEGEVKAIKTEIDNMKGAA